MCGFVLAYAKTDNGVPTQALLDSMDNAIAHRGPDEHGQIRIGPVLIGHRRLSIIDLSGGKQPMMSHDGRLWIAFNGEIYNYKDVRADLITLGHRFTEQSDTEVLLAAWQQWGKEGLKRLNGMFAFVVYDVQKQTIIAARDRFGEKPLYYFEDGRTLYLASELKALLAAGVVDRRVNPSALYSYFTLGYITEDQAIFQGVKRLMPGHLLEYVPKSSARQTEWWRPTRPTNEIDDIDTTVKESLDLLRDAVRLRMISDVPLGLFLSGGVDSSLIVALAAETAGHQIETFSIGFDDARYDERSHARFVANRFSTRHHEFVLKPASIDVLERVAWHADEPFADPAALPTWFLSELTRQHVKVALSGDGGDELFAGYNVYRSYNLSERVRRLPASIRQLAVVCLRASTDLCGDRFNQLQVIRNIEDAALAAPYRFIAKQQTVFRRDFLHKISPVLAEVSSVKTDQRMFSELFATDIDPLAAIALWQQTVSLPDDMLHKVDRMSMAHSLEVRAPFLDHRLCELLNRTSFRVKLNGGRSKFILRKCLEHYLPAAFVQRPKHGFSVPLTYWFKDDLAYFIRDRLLSPESVVQHVIKKPTIENIFAEHKRGVRDWSLTLWALLMFELWCRSYSISADNILDA